MSLSKITGTSESKVLRQFLDLPQLGLYILEGHFVAPLVIFLSSDSVSTTETSKGLQNLLS
jgi:hypothetical protein